MLYKGNDHQPRTSFHVHRCQLPPKYIQAEAQDFELEFPRSTLVILHSGLRKLPPQPSPIARESACPKPNPQYYPSRTLSWVSLTTKKKPPIYPSLFWLGRVSRSEHHGFWKETGLSTFSLLLDWISERAGVYNVVLVPFVTPFFPLPPQREPHTRPLLSPLFAGARLSYKSSLCNIRYCYPHAPYLHARGSAFLCTSPQLIALVFFFQERWGSRCS